MSKKRHHFVWKRYLEEFANLEGKKQAPWIYQISKETLSSRYIQTYDAGVRSNLYTLREKITDNDRAYFKKLLGNDLSDKFEKAMVDELIEDLNCSYSLFRSNGLSEIIMDKLERNINSGDGHITKRQEERFSIYETDFFPLYENLIAGDISWYKPDAMDLESYRLYRRQKSHQAYMAGCLDYLSYLVKINNCQNAVDIKALRSEMREIEHSDTLHVNDSVKNKYSFIAFILTQFFRTKHKYELIEQQTKEFAERSGQNNLNPKAIICLVTHYQILAKTGSELVLAPFRIELLHNDTDIPFITGDQPIANTVPMGTSEDIEFFYPLTPRLALLFTCFPNISKTNTLSDYEVKAYNKLIFEQSDEFIFSRRPSIQCYM